MSHQTFEIRRKNINCVIPVWPLQECRSLSLAAKGLLCLLLSFAHGWEIRMSDIISRSRNGRDSTRKAVQELLKAGYLVKVYIRENGKLVGSKYIVYDQPKQ
ncbi:helix-turn-helix domain-containing protein [Dendrosporobacter sp. 1207_IL3150]|uniref:helix-turn-helix domain-containing protein n=1 Tax=Dendrosporobacter sp. 1207_IL3150 TaxID=3084054 RepID=UPI002FDB5FB5